MIIFVRATSGEERCMTTLIMAAKETSGDGEGKIIYF